MELSEQNDDSRFLSEKRREACERLKNEPGMDNLWDAMLAFAGYPFKTSNGLVFTYEMKKNRHGDPGNELLFSRKEKTITRSTVAKAYEKALELGGEVSGPKKLGTFGASYIYPVFLRLGVIKEKI